MLYETGRDDIPVAVGRATTTGGSVNQYPWAEDFDATKPIGQSAAEYLVEQVNATPGELTIIPIGPFTNIGDALQLDPDLGKKCDFVIMGGRVGWPSGATPEIEPEYNIVTDIPASQAMLSCGAPMTMVPLDSTYRVKLEAENRERILNAGTPLTDGLVGMLQCWPGQTPVLHDPLAIGMAIDDTLCGVADLHIICDDEGNTRPVEGTPNMRVAVTPNVGRFLALFMERLLGQKLGR
jgi:inosine-uridine nucleoside N-ribohydrolase